MTDELLYLLAVLEPVEAAPLLAKLEAAGIPFELEINDEALRRPDRWWALTLGMFPDGPKHLIFVPEAHLEAAQRLLPPLGDPI